MANLKPLFIGFVGALAAILLALTVSVAYQDHVIVRALLQIEQQRAAAAQPPAKPQ